MPNLTVWAYDTPLGAQAGELRLKSLQQRGAVTVEDAITVAWLPGAPQPRVGHLPQASSLSAGRGSVLGGLIGLLVLAPAAGAAADAGIAAVARRLHATGIDQQFIEETVALLGPGSSALFVLSTGADLDVVRPAVERGLARGDVVLLHAELTQDAPDAIRNVVKDLLSDQTCPDSDGSLQDGLPPILRGM